MSDEYDIVVIGAGPGGHAAAEEAARLGARVAIVERDKWGGTCAHLGCIPTKALLACSKRYAELGKLKRLGVPVSGAGYDYSAMKRHQGQMVRLSALGVQKSLDDVGVKRMEGTGKILSPSEVEVIPIQGDRMLLRAKNILIAWGSEPSTVPGIRISGRIMDSSGFLSMERIPSSVLIVGGGAIGIEFANLLAELGVRVAVIELLDQILPNEDQEAVGFLAAELKKLGIEIHTSTRVASLEETAEGVHLRGKKGEEIIELLGECALICTGRKPSLRREDLDRAGIAYSAKGIIVDNCQQTTVKNIFALGDVTGGILLAHRASAQGKALACYLFGDGGFYYREEWVPGVVYTHPSVARVGLTEKEARGRGLDLEIRKVEYGANINARTELRGNGFLKALFVEKRLIGVTIVGDEAGELIAAMGLAIANGMGDEELKKWVLPHPSLSELLSF